MYIYLLQLVLLIVLVVLGFQYVFIFVFDVWGELLVMCCFFYEQVIDGEVCYVFVMLVFFGQIGLDVVGVCSLIEVNL